MPAGRQSIGKVPKSVKRPQPKGGSRKGVPNKTTAALKDMILQALSESGGVSYLKAQAKAKPVAFLTLLGKVLPMQVTGADGGDIKAKITVEYVRPGNPTS